MWLPGVVTSIDRGHGDGCCSYVVTMKDGATRETLPDRMRAAGGRADAADTGAIASPVCASRVLCVRHVQWLQNVCECGVVASTSRLKIQAPAGHEGGGVLAAVVRAVLCALAWMLQRVGLVHDPKGEATAAAPCKCAGAPCTGAALGPVPACFDRARPTRLCQRICSSLRCVVSR